MFDAWGLCLNFFFKEIEKEFLKGIFLKTGF